MNGGDILSIDYERIGGEGARHLSVGLSLMLTFVLASLASCNKTNAQHSNLLLIVVDTLRADTVSFAGYWRNTSPNLDALARDSFVFENAMSGGTNTSTAMPAIMTSRLAFFSEVAPPCEAVGCDARWNEQTWFGMQRFYEDGERGLPLSLDTLAEVLSRAGYNTAGYITNPHLKKRYQFGQGFDTYGEIFRPSYPNYGLGETVSEAAIQFMTRPVAEPFFLYLHYMDPHAPYLPPKEHRNRFLSFQEIEDIQDKELFQDWTVRKGFENDDSGATKAYLRALYDAEVAYVDRCIGAVLKQLKDSGFYEDTIVVVTSDHGEEFFEHGETGHPGRFYEEHIRVPLLIRSPGLRSGRVDALVRNFDIMPTVLDILGVPHSSKGMDGRTLLPLMKGAEELDLDVFATLPFLETRRMIRDDRYKMVLHAEDPQKNRLYDLWQDPGETRDLYDKRAYEGVRRDLENRMDRIIRKLRSEYQTSEDGLADPPGVLDEETLEQLRALGYTK